MKNDSNVETSRVHLWAKKGRAVCVMLNWGLALWILALVAGCQTQAPQPNGVKDQTAVTPEIIALREGDVLKISFPGSPSLDTTQQIRRDGKITLPLIGEVQAAGMSAEALQENLVKTYAPQLSTKEVIVTLTSSTFPVFVTGSVIHPGKIVSDHPITALDAIMEAGGFDYNTANLRAVRVIRHAGDRVENYTLNLKLVLDGKENRQFYLQPSDIVFVPERLSWF
ncbi:MAG: polysaccharide biosynthesis/export family protein [Verrucomicrobiia bacterium]|jgi:polysaccharide export outer membrane protein